jgi:hypothetical protein
LGTTLPNIRLKKLIIFPSWLCKGNVFLFIMFVKRSYIKL